MDVTVTHDLPDGPSETRTGDGVLTTDAEGKGFVSRLADPCAMIGKAKEATVPQQFWQRAEPGRRHGRPWMKS